MQNSDENFVFENEVAQVRWVSEEEVETLPMAKEWKSALDDYFKTSGKY